MIIRGICATPDTAIDGNILLANSVDITQRPPLWINHKHQVGEVVQLFYVGGNLHIVAETDDAAAVKLGHLSIAGRPIEREQRDGRWLVSRFHTMEISVVRDPVNKICRVYERSATDPIRAYTKARAAHADLLVQGCASIAKTLRQLGALHGSISN